MHYLALLIILSILSVIILRSLKRKTHENYTSEFCPDCNNNGWWDQGFCQRCLNCGWSVGSDGHGECIPGTRKGPIINNNTKEWYHGGDLIWSDGNIPGNNILEDENEMPLDFSRPFQRTDVSYGKHRHGRAFGQGWDPIYQFQKM